MNRNIVSKDTLNSLASGSLDEGRKCGLLGNRTRRCGYPNLSWLHRLDGEIHDFPAERREIDPQVARHGPDQTGSCGPDIFLDMFQPVPIGRKHVRFSQPIRSTA